MEIPLDQTKEQYLESLLTERSEIVLGDTDCFQHIIAIQKRYFNRNDLEALNFDYSEDQATISSSRWNNHLVSLGYDSPSAMFLDNGFILANEPQALDVAWVQFRLNGTSASYTSDLQNQYSTEYQTEAFIYNGEYWLKRKSNKWIKARLLETFVRANGIYRPTTS